MVILKKCRGVRGRTKRYKSFRNDRFLTEREVRNALDYACGLDESSPSVEREFAINRIYDAILDLEDANQRTTCAPVDSGPFLREAEDLAKLLNVNRNDILS